jgi:hypothetical protein
LNVLQDESRLSRGKPRQMSIIISKSKKRRAVMESKLFDEPNGPLSGAFKTTTNALTAWNRSRDATMRSASKVRRIKGKA